MDWTIVFSPEFFIGLLSATVALAVPLILAALGEVFVERAGVLNMGIEGMMLMGALAAFVGCLLTKSSLGGVIACLAVGVLVALIMAVITINFLADQAITGIVLNILATGITGYFSKLFFGFNLMPTVIDSLPVISIPVLAQIPLLGTVLFQQNILTYIAVLLVPISSFVLFRTNFGLQVRMVGGNAAAADTMGIDVFKIRYLCLMIGGALAGLAGGSLSLSIGMFAEGMSANRGFIAIALVMFSRWNPYGVLAGALLFGFADAFQLRLQSLGFTLPYQFLLMLPYVLTVIVLVLAARNKFINPSILGVPYTREAK